jgi:hypothetical protein
VRWVRRSLFTSVVSIAVLLALGASSVSGGMNGPASRASRIHPDLTSRTVVNRALPRRPAGEAFLLVHLPGESALGSPRWGWAVSRRRGRAAVLTQGPASTVTRHVALASYQVRWTRIHIAVSLHRWQLTVWLGRHALGRFPIADGGPSTPTPTGRFVVTDRVDYPAGSIYGSFALGLSAHQLHRLPAGWVGGNQIAIHGTDDPSSIGQSVSLGCLRVGPAALALLHRSVLLGSPVVISP